MTTTGDAQRFASRLPVAFIFRACGALCRLRFALWPPRGDALRFALIFRVFGAL
jgi:hypothetical protein